MASLLPALRKPAAPTAHCSPKAEKLKPAMPMALASLESCVLKFMICIFLDQSLKTKSGKWRWHEAVARSRRQPINQTSDYYPDTVLGWTFFRGDWL